MSVVLGPFDPPEPDAAELHDAVGAELAVDPYELSPRELGARCLRLHAERDRLDMAIAASDACFERTRAHRKLGKGYRRASQWLAHQRRIPRKVANRSYRHARRLMHLPRIRAAVLAGAMTAWHARTITDVCGDPARPGLMTETEGEFIERAERLDGRGFDSAARYWDEVNFADDAAARAEKADEQRQVNLVRTFEQVLHLGGKLHPVYGTVVADELSRLEGELFTRDWEAAKAIHGEDTNTTHLRRTTPQRRHDALVAMAIRSAALGAESRSMRPQVTVLVDWDRLEGRLCELADGTHVVPEQVAELVPLADLERAVMTSPNRVEVSERSRLFRGATWRAIELRDRFCTAPGCETPAQDCEADHEQPYGAGGLTVQDNGRMRCPQDHDGRRRDPEHYPLPWEHCPETWGDEPPERDLDLEADMAAIRDQAVAEAARSRHPACPADHDHPETHAGSDTAVADEPPNVTDDGPEDADDDASSGG